MSARALVLDFGGVITRTIFETHRQTERALSLPGGALTWRGPFDPSSDPLWVEMQNDLISEREYYAKRCAEVAELIGADWSEMSQFVRAARGADPESVIRPEALAAIYAAHRDGHRLAILSNEMDLFYGADFRAKLPFLTDFDVIYDATYTDVLKPDVRAYLSCAEELRVSPSDCVFVDDQARNVEGARAVGMQAVLFDVTRPAAGFDDALALLQTEKVKENA